jgi:hypothetical protein
MKTQHLAVRSKMTEGWTMPILNGEGAPPRRGYQVFSVKRLRMDETPLGVRRPHWQSLTRFDLDAANNDVAY